MRFQQSCVTAAVLYAYTNVVCRTGKQNASLSQLACMDVCLNIEDSAMCLVIFSQSPGIRIDTRSIPMKT